MAKLFQDAPFCHEPNVSVFCSNCLVKLTPEALNSTVFLNKEGETDPSVGLGPQLWAQLNFDGPEFIFAKFWEVLKNHMAAKLILNVM